MIYDILAIKKQFNDYIEEFVEEFNISLIYIFGSIAKNKQREDSDLDIAIYCDERVDGYTKLRILGRLVDVFKREDIDLVILNDANEILKFQVIKYGINIYKGRELNRVLFEAETMSRYMDMEYFRNTQYKYSRNKILYGS